MADRMKVFLGGTCNESTWRNRMIIYLDQDGLDAFNPVVKDWDEKAQENELRERRTCDFCLYTITPKMTGVYSIAEVIDDSNKRPEKTVLVLLKSDGDLKFTQAQGKSLASVAKMVVRNGSHVFDNLKDAAVWMGKESRLMTCKKLHCPKCNKEYGSGDLDGYQDRESLCPECQADFL